MHKRDANPEPLTGMTYKPRQPLTFMGGEYYYFF